MITRTEFYDDQHVMLAHIAEMERADWQVRSIVKLGELPRPAMIVVYERER